ncbi:prolyl-tRNA editing protein [Aerococcus urinaeequi]|uniref:prolyl-tRNA synthetase associated domain-containing protein n=1 Tax=Aerococcus TaxID=1375 RepID=UPI000744D4E6|nr:prolyl-tRNA synthetase associated domain-containing protein [Aerococcus urinaeequi]ALZ87535.1 prolyl-tRNA editing protein [Aerococcus urinaeequi]MDT2762108.1 prolyl-tRNA synthetase associated domain-containing protein [Aerococcus urinaeequi]
MDKAAVYDFLNDQEIEYEVTDHKAVYDMAELAEIDLPYPEADAKNLFIRDDKKRQYYLISVQGDKRVDLKAFRDQFNTRRLSFGSDKDLLALMGLTPGAVSPLGLLNDHDLKIAYYLDRQLVADDHLIGVHPNENTATIWLKGQDLVDLIEANGHSVTVADF